MGLGTERPPFGGRRDEYQLASDSAWKLYVGLSFAKRVAGPLSRQRAGGAEGGGAKYGTGALSDVAWPSQMGAAL